MAEYCLAHLMEMAAGSFSKIPYPVLRAKILGSSYDKPNSTETGCPRCKKT